MSCSRQIVTALPPSVVDPAADAHQQVAAGIARLVGAGDHRVAWAVRGHVVMQAGIA
jgi:hypothetical protein